MWEATIGVAMSGKQACVGRRVIRLKTTALEASETQKPHDGLTTERLNCLYSIGKGLSVPHGR